jgi:hypothetical protein
MALSNPSEEEVETKRFVLDGRCVAFVGAGISIPPSKNWLNTVKDIAERCEVPFEDRRPLPEIIDECIDKSEFTCTEVCRDFFPRHTTISRTAINYLFRLPFKAILTTNFDPWLRQQSRQKDYKQCHAYPDLPLHLGLEQRIYYLHGYFDSNDKDARH